MLISVIMPAYNAEPTIRDSIESIKNQTYPFWELLVIDDGSSDRTQDVVQSLARTEKRIQIFCQNVNKGVSESRNLGLTLSKGQFIAFCDADDLWFPNKLEVQIKQFQNTKVGIVYSSYKLFKDTCEPSARIIGAPAVGNFNSLTFSNYICMSSAVVRRECLNEISFPRIKMHEDYAFWLLLMKKPIEARGCAAPLVWYRESQYGLSSNKIRAARYHWTILRDFTALKFLPRLIRFGAYLKNGIAKHGVKRIFINLR